MSNFPVNGVHDRSAEAIPASAEWLIERIQGNPLSEGGCILASYLAAFVCPGAMCDLLGLEDLDANDQRQAILFLKSCQTVGLSVEQMANILTRIRPYIRGMTVGELH
jgi:hypothetical protein